MLNDIERAVRKGKDWLLKNQITAETQSYDMIRWNDDRTKAEWYDAPVPQDLIGAYYANLMRNDPWMTTPGEVRQQYYNTWHTAQAGVALLEYRDLDDDAAVRQSVDLAWDFIQRHQVKTGKYKGVFVEALPEELEPELESRYSFGYSSLSTRWAYASYDNIETDLFPLELYERTKDESYLQGAYDNAAFFLANEPDLVFFERETHTVAISGMSNDAIYGRLAKYTGEERFAEVFRRQIRALSQLSLDLRADNNIRNIYWDCTALMYAIDQFPELLGPAMAKLAFLAETTLFAQKPTGQLWFRYKESGVIDREHQRSQDGAATFGMVRVWGKMYDVTGDKRWLEAIRKAVEFALTQQYDETYGPKFSGAFQYAGEVEYEGHRFDSLRDISTIFGLRALIPLLQKNTAWARDFWR